MSVFVDTSALLAVLDADDDSHPPARRIWVDLLQRAEDLFLMGMFSLIDTILNRPLAEILKEIPIAEDVKAALLGRENRLRSVYDFILTCEKGDWENLSKQAAALGIQENRAYQIYLEALKWSYRCFKMEED